MTEDQADYDAGTPDENRKPRTCGSCQYRVEGECRCVPPQVTTSHGYRSSEYPDVAVDFPACGMWCHDRRGSQP